ncbi:MAG: hypothetical protein FWE37_04545 [Spirochaetaceae bacterium]|nr:hypothetical protein [Spirochaetaceae bacterium]
MPKYLENIKVALVKSKNPLIYKAARWVKYQLSRVRYYPKVRQAQKNSKTVLAKLKQDYGKRPIRVGFLVNKNELWSAQSLYQNLKANANFEVKVILTPFNFEAENTDIPNWYRQNIAFFAGRNIPLELAYDINTFTALPLDNYRLDIVFYQRPWYILPFYEPLKLSRYSLTCYLPYCFYMLNVANNYFPHFQPFMWRYFVESPLYEKDYKRKYGAKNVIGLGSLKFDEAIISRSLQSSANSAIKAVTAVNNAGKPVKKRIIYAPHHTFTGFPNRLSFTWSGEAILKLAQATQNDFEWVIKPHPSFRQHTIAEGLLSESEIDNYLAAWQKLGAIYMGGDYQQNVFAGSSLLITDCISFLAEYLPVGAPIIELISQYFNEKLYSVVGKQVVSANYKVYNEKQLMGTFDDLMLKGHDPHAEARAAVRARLVGDEPVGKKIADYLVKNLQS